MANDLDIDRLGHPVESDIAYLSLAAIPAAALDVNVGASGTVGVDAGASAGVQAQTRASVQAEGNAESEGGASASLHLSTDDELTIVIGLIETSTWSRASFSALGEVSARVYDINAWIDSENEAALESALAANAEEVADLQAAPRANASFEAFLEANNAAASAVVAVGVAVDGSLAIFTR